MSVSFLYVIQQRKLPPPHSTYVVFHTFVKLPLPPTLFVTQSQQANTPIPGRICFTLSLRQNSQHLPLEIRNNLSGEGTCKEWLDISAYNSSMLFFASPPWMSADFTTIFVVTAFCSLYKTKWKGGILQYSILKGKRGISSQENIINVAYHLQVDAVFSKSRGWGIP